MTASDEAASDEAARREAVRSAVAARTPINDAERDSIATLLAHLDTLAHPFDEHADPVHVTGSAFVVGPRGVVLLHHKKMGIVKKADLDAVQEALLKK